MIKEVRLPEIAENVENGDVIKVLVSVGDVVDTDQPLVELETEKAVLEVPSPFNGKVTEILVKEGDTIQIDQVILKIETEVETAQPTEANAPASDATEPSETSATSETAGKEGGTKEDVDVDRNGDGDSGRGATAGTTEGESASPVLSPETETGRAPAGPPVSVKTSDRRDDSPKSAPDTPSRAGRSPASPSLRRFARELGIDISKVTGTGPGGRIVEEDLKNFTRDVVTGARGDESAAADRAESTKWGPVVREPMSRVRQATARSMNQAWSTIPHVTQYDRVDITELDDIRRQYSKKMETHGGKLTMTAILLKVAASALKVFPQFNASLDVDNKEITYKRYYHVGVAVDTDRGLLVPVIRNVDKKNIAELSAELNGIAQKAREFKLSLEDMDGGTFTISNLGGIGGTNFSPIVYPPQVAILGVARARMEPVYLNNQFEPRLILPLSVSYDHRLIDGADGARFLRWIAEALEEPILLALEG